jgi:hypothetical protein
MSLETQAAEIVREHVCASTTAATTHFQTDSQESPFIQIAKKGRRMLESWYTFIPTGAEIVYH